MSQSYNFSSYSLTTEIVPSNLTQTRFFLGTQNEDSVTVSTDPLSLNNFNTFDGNMSWTDGDGTLLASIMK